MIASKRKQEVLSTLVYDKEKKRNNSGLFLNDDGMTVQLLRDYAFLAKDQSCISEDLGLSAVLHKQLHESSQTHTYTYNSHN